jgi:alkylation response protein AidB-like acyl-CoA dehydrogenase
MQPHEFVLPKLNEHADAADADPFWPAASWRLAGEIGALRWAIPAIHGGEGLEGRSLLRRYRLLAQHCLTTAFLLSQRDAAVRRLRDADNAEARDRLLPPLARGETFITVGLSQLTTSRQHTAPTLRVEVADDAVRIDGIIPWVTGAAKAEHLVVGGVQADGRQVLLVLPTNLPGVTIGAPLDLMALRGSLTTEVRCDDVRVDRRWLLAGPAEKVLVSPRGGTGGLETSCLAIGLAAAAIDLLRREATDRPALLGVTRRLLKKHNALRRRMYALAETPAAPDAAAGLRGKANLLALRATQAALTASKGTGFVRPHPAQRWARQALFFLVWSCPRPAAEATLGFLFGECDA